MPTHLTMADIPGGLSPLGRQAAIVIVEKTLQHRATYTGGCTTFYTPAEWRSRGEPLEDGAVLVVVYDGGDVGRLIDYERCCPGGGARGDYEPLTDTAAALRAAGAVVQPVTNWYAEVWPL